jgi:hypothetical protein
MSTTVTNKTRKPLSIQLGPGKKLFLGPGKSGEIAAKDVELATVKALIEGGAIEVAQGRGQAGAGDSHTGGRPSQGHSPTTGGRRSGDR